MTTSLEPGGSVGILNRMLYLASRSPRRHQLLAQIGAAFEVVPVDVPEVRRTHEPAVAYVSRVARDKARAGLQRLRDDPSAAVIGADTEVVLDDEVFGKPADAAQASAMLRRLSGCTHQAVSTVWLLHDGRELEARCISDVTMTSLDEADIADYVSTGESFGKAGGYAIQGRAAVFIANLRGSYSAVMGLPLFETAALLRQAGLDSCMPAQEGQAR